MIRQANDRGHNGLRARRRLVSALTIATTLALGLPVSSLASSTPSAPQTASAGKAPAAPTNVTASCGDAAAQVSWTASKAAGGSPVTSYAVTAYAGTTLGPSTSVGGSTTTASVNGLTNGTQYTFHVVATSSGGSSPPGVSSPCTPLGPPSAPQNANAVAGDSQATVSWAAPASNGGSATTSYTVTPYQGTMAGTPTTVSAATASTTITGLSNGSSYTFQVYATNGVGHGPAASTSAVLPHAAINSVTGKYLYLRTTSTMSQDAYHYGYVSQAAIPNMSNWTVEGEMWKMSGNLVTFGSIEWGLLSGTASAGPGGAVVGIHMNLGGGPLVSSFVWPGGSCQIPSDGPGFPQAADGGTPGHFALTYDGSTVRGFINGHLVCSQATASAATTATVSAGFMDNNELNVGAFDDLRISSVARYASDFAPPTSGYVVDANTLALYTFEDYPITKLSATQLPNNTYQVFNVNGVFGDTSGHNNSLAEVYYGTGCVGCIYFNGPTYHPYSLAQGVTADELAGGGSPWICPCTRGETHYPVDTTTGEFWHTFDDLSIPGRGLAFDFSQTYSSHLASQLGRLGYGWNDSYAMSLGLDLAGNATVKAGNGSAEVFSLVNGTFQPASRVLATLVKNGDGTYTLTDKAQAMYTFDASGKLIRESDRNGYTTTLTYNGGNQLTTVTDPAGRTFTLTYSGNGLVQQVSDSGGRSVSLAYDAGNNLTQITDVGGGLTKFTYASNHLLLTMKDPNCSASTACAGVTNVYDGSSRVTQQTDDMGRVTKFSYPDGYATTTTDPNGNQTVDESIDGVLVSTTRGSGTAQQATWTYGYDAGSLGLASVTDPNGHVTKTTRDPQANVLTQTDALSRTHTYTYNSFSEVLTDKDPLNVTTTYGYDTSGNLTSVTRPLTGTAQTATQSYTYGDASHPGDVTQMTDPDGKVWLYGYDQYGNRNSLTDPLTDQTKFGFDVLGRMTSKITPKGNVTGGTPSQFTWAYSYDAFGALRTATDPLSHVTTYTYDANRNQTQVLDANLHPTSYTYDADDELTLVTRPDQSTQGTGYDANGNMTAQTDGLQHTTTYTYDPLNRLATTVDPLSRKTTYGYDGAGNLKTLLDPQSQTTTYSYDPANEVTSITYSDGVTPNVSLITYDSDGQRSTMTDGTGQTTYTVDSLHRLTQSTSGAGSQLQYGYDLKAQLTSLTYPGGVNQVTRAWDDAGRLRSVSDWLSHTTTFTYDPNSNQTDLTYPNSTSAAWTFDNADRLTAISDSGPSGNFLSLSYPRDPVGQVTAENSTAYGYDNNNRLKSSGSQTYGYDAADELTSTPASSLMSYDVANELTSSQAVTGQTTYGYDLRGNRTQVTPPAPGTAVNLGYDQANRLKSYGSSASYGYNGDGLRMSKTVGATTSQETWDLASSAVPTMVQDGTTSYVTGPGGLPLEQISGSTATYYHCDQLGSTRALTNQAGDVVETASYDAYGAPTTSGSSTPFGFAGQYTDAESGLVYLRARYYDPSTGQFISRDPAVASTRQPYAYVADNPLNGTDPSGLCDWNPFSGDSCGAAVVGVAVRTAEGFFGGGGAAAAAPAAAPEVAAAPSVGVFGFLGTVAAPALGLACGASLLFNTDNAGDTTNLNQTPDGPALKRKGEELLGRSHSDAGKQRFNDWYNGLTKAEKEAARKAGMKRASKRQG